MRGLVPHASPQGFSIVFGELFNIFYTSTPAQIRTDSAYIAAGALAATALWLFLTHTLAAFVGLAVYNLATGYLGQMLWGVVGEQVGLHFRQNFFTALLRQEVGYYDSEQTGKMTTILSTNIDNLRSGTGVKVSMWVMFATQALVGVIIAFVYSWKLTLVLCVGEGRSGGVLSLSPRASIAISPLMALGGVLQMRLLANSTQSQNAAFSDATNLAVQCLNAISTVASVQHGRGRGLAVDRFLFPFRSRCAVSSSRGKARRLGATLGSSTKRRNLAARPFTCPLSRGARRFSSCSPCTPLASGTDLDLVL